ncbi:hypothetical protein MLD38_022311 [Melastoma candidum]|uniref:Uncharacterized protein n=1 Tax=Melastoma candidum TaxID=119954 RepID=A0ACB9QIV2_9MYRT|nr:hypothetical protein MLD38_022311 [Melastoma candidum]
MGSNNLNFGNFGGGEPPPNNGLLGSLQLTRQPSVYSLTFDEFQSNLGGPSKDFGSMNMDELLKSIWSEENKFLASASGAGGQDPGGNLQRQGSLTLPRTLSQKTVDKVWKDIAKEFAPEKESSAIGVAPAMPQREPTLGEVTLEEFLVKAGIVREDALFGSGKVGNGSMFSDPTPEDKDALFGTGLGAPALDKGVNLMGMKNLHDDNHLIPIHPLNRPHNLNGARPNQQQQQSLTRTLPQILPKNPVTPPFNGIRGGLPDKVVGNNMVQTGVLQSKGLGIVGLGAAPIAGTLNSPTSPVSSDGIRSNGDSSSLSPVPYVFNGGLRGRKCSATVEKVVERRQRRMIKNRESAARSRARKQAYTMELEAEVAKLKEENEELWKKQAEIIEMQKNQGVEMKATQRGAKRQCLRRTQTGPW